MASSSSAMTRSVAVGSTLRRGGGPPFPRKDEASLPVVGDSRYGLFVFNNVSERTKKNLSHIEFPYVVQETGGAAAYAVVWYEQNDGKYYVFSMPLLAESSVEWLHFVQECARTDWAMPGVSAVADYLNANTVPWTIDCDKGSIVEAIRGSAATLRDPVHIVLDVKRYTKVLNFDEDVCDAYLAAPIDLDNSTETKLCVRSGLRGWLSKANCRVLHDSRKSKLRGQYGLIWKIKSLANWETARKLNPIDAAMLRTFARERIHVGLGDKLKAGINFRKGEKQLTVTSGVTVTPSEREHMAAWLRRKIPAMAEQWSAFTQTKKKWTTPISVAYAVAIFGRQSLVRKWPRNASIDEPFQVHLGVPITLNYDTSNARFSVTATCYLNTIRSLT